MLSPQFIYDLAVIEAALASRPHLDGRLRHRLMGEAPVGFPEARCSSLQLARILGATDRYQGLGFVADDVEQCLAAGLALPWMTTSSRAQLRSGLAEARAARELIRHGFDIEDLDRGNGQERVPEFAARKPELEFAVEVYAPRDWQVLADFTDELGDHLLHLPLAVDYTVDLAGRRSKFTV